MRSASTPCRVEWCDQPADTEGRLVPILDDSNFGLVTFYDPTNGAPVQKGVETPGEGRVTFTNWHHYLGDLGIEIDDDDRLRRVAEIVGFRHFDELLSFFDACRGDTAEEFDRRKARFIGAIAT